MDVNNPLKATTKDLDDRHNADVVFTILEVRSQDWLYLDRVKEGYAPYWRICGMGISDSRSCVENVRYEWRSLITIPANPGGTSIEVDTR